MLFVKGEAERGQIRKLEVEKQPDGRVYVWIHSYKDESDGYGIYVYHKELLDLLKMTGVVKA